MIDVTTGLAEATAKTWAVEFGANMSPLLVVLNRALACHGLPCVA